VHDPVVVVAGGEALRPDVASRVPADARVLAADRGVAFALALGLRVESVIGDLDSALPSDVAEAVASGARVERHPRDKNATDLELALDAAMALGAEEILVLVDDGGRLDHTLSALLLLGAPRYSGCRLDAQVGRALVHVVRDERVLAGEPGEIVSLLAVHGPAEGVRTDGLAFPLAGETLLPGSSRGVSNVFFGETARVSLEQGVVLAVRPGPEIEEQEEAR
jgi:thiamine pyrophosphokinase